MQPYFFPYPGYFRLLAVADVFVIFDCVQFPRRGRIHRCQVAGTAQAPAWLTLPLARQPRGVLIRDLLLTPGAGPEFRRRVERLKWVAEARGPSAAAIRHFLDNPSSPLIDYLENGLEMVAQLLEFDVKFIRSSSFGIDPTIHGKDRVIALATAAGAQRYVNPSGGRALYDAASFAAAGIELCFLPAYAGHFSGMLQALLTESPESIRQDIVATSVIEGP